MNTAALQYEAAKSAAFQYEAAKQRWLQAHPQASATEYEQAMARIAEECGL